VSERDERGDGDEIITLEAANGHSYPCRILGVFEVDKKEYALLLKLSDADDPDDEGGVSTVFMQLIETNDGAIFRTIETDEEFERVVAHVKGLAVTEPPQKPDALT